MKCLWFLTAIGSSRRCFAISLDPSSSLGQYLLLCRRVSAPLSYASTQKWQVMVPHGDDAVEVFQNLVLAAFKLSRLGESAALASRLVLDLT